jgi:hypothetical protein
MKTIILSPKEYMLMRELANKYNYMFEIHTVFDSETKINMVHVTIDISFCEAFGF